LKSITDGGHPETGITVERLGKLTERVGRERDRLLEGKAVPLFHDTYLSAAHVVLTDGLRSSSQGLFQG
jgi:hypothetical protein